MRMNNHRHRNSHFITTLKIIAWVLVLIYFSLILRTLFLSKELVRQLSSSSLSSSLLFFGLSPPANSNNGDGNVGSGLVSDSGIAFSIIDSTHDEGGGNSENFEGGNGKGNVDNDNSNDYSNSDSKVNSDVDRQQQQRDRLHKIPPILSPPPYHPQLPPVKIYVQNPPLPREWWAGGDDVTETSTNKREYENDAILHPLPIIRSSSSSSSSSRLKSIILNDDAIGSDCQTHPSSTFYHRNNPKNHNPLEDDP